MELALDVLRIPRKDNVRRLPKFDNEAVEGRRVEGGAIGGSVFSSCGVETGWEWAADGGVLGGTG
jgi:hypothetical protein